MAIKGSMLKYFRDHGGPDSAHGGYLLWPGTADGYPVRSNSPLPPDLRQDEFEQIPVAFDYHSREFKLWLPEEKQQFDDVMDCIVNGWFMEFKRRDRETPDGIAVWLEWIQIYGETRTGKTPPPGAPPHVQQVTLQPGDAPARYAPPPVRPLAVSRVFSEPLGFPDEGRRRPAPGPAEAGAD